MMNASRKPISEIFSSNLRRMLKEKGATQAELSRYMGISTPTVNNWCKGKIIPLLDKMDALCTFFACEPSDLLREQSEEKRECNKRDKNNNGLEEDPREDASRPGKSSSKEQMPEAVLNWLIQAGTELQDRKFLIMINDYIMSDERGKKNIRETAARERAIAVSKKAK